MRSRTLIIPEALSKAKVVVGGLVGTAVKLIRSWPAMQTPGHVGVAAAWAEKGSTSRTTAGREKRTESPARDGNRQMTTSATRRRTA